MLLSIKEHSLLYWTGICIMALLAASPFLNRVLVHPRVEFFTELWILDADRRGENYPYNITRGQTYTIHLSIANHLGHCAYYIVQVKFRNQSQPAPISFGPLENRSPSSLPSLFNIPVFVANEQSIEIPIAFSFNYILDKHSPKIKILSLKLNDVLLNMDNCLISWDPERKAFQGFLFFELWLYNITTNNFHYHGCFTGLWLNMTISLEP